METGNMKFEDIYKEITSDKIEQSDSIGKLKSDLQEALISLCEREIDDIQESFKKESTLEYHFNKHCVAGDLEKVKNRKYKEDLFYNYNNIDQYKSRIRFMDNFANFDIRGKVRYINFAADDVTFRREVQNLDRKLQYGNFCVIFDNVRDANSNSVMKVKLYAFTPEDQVYPSKKAVDLAIYSGGVYTKTQFPIAYDGIEKTVLRVVREASYDIL